jgi:hypothetical protein
LYSSVSDGCKKRFAMKNQPTGEKTTIRGIVTPETWDEDFNVCTVKICAADEEDYVVARNRKGEELLRHLRESLRVSGTIRRNKDGTQIIIVNEFRRAGG